MRWASLPYQSGQQEITYPAKLISDNFQSVNRGHSPKDGIWNNPLCLVLLSACIRIYSNVDDYRAINKARIDIKYKWEKMVAALTSTSSRYQIPQ